MRQFRNEAFVLSLVLICVEGIVRTLSARVAGLVPRFCLDLLGLPVLYRGLLGFSVPGLPGLHQGLLGFFRCRGCRACTKVYLDLLGAGVAGLAPSVARIFSAGVAGLVPRFTWIF